MRKILFLILLLPILAYSQKEIIMEEYNGVYMIPCEVNGIPMKFIFDTGASGVSISKTEVSFLYKQGLITSQDVVGETQYVIADGQIKNGVTINIKTIKIDDILLRNILATVVDNENAPLLLGQSAIQQLGQITLEDDKLILNEKSSDVECRNKIFPFEIGNTKFDIVEKMNSTESFKKDEDEFGISEIVSEVNNGWRTYKNVEDELYINVLNLEYTENNCVKSNKNHIQLTFADDFLYKASITMDFEPNDYQLALEQYNLILENIPEEYGYLVEYPLTSKTTKEKIGKAATFYIEEDYSFNDEKKHEINVWLLTNFNKIQDYKSGKPATTGKVTGYEILIDFVDLRKTKLTSSQY